MADSRREQILKAIQTELAAIKAGDQAGKTGNTYTYTIESAQRWEQRGQIEADVPFIVIVPATEEKEEQTESQQVCRLIIEIQIWARHDYDALSAIPTDTYLSGLLSDAEKAIMKDRSWGGLAHETHVTGNAMFEDETGQAYAGVILEIEVRYKHSIIDPDAFV